MKKCISAVLVIVLVMSCICIPASAMENAFNEEETAIARATGRFSMDISANTYLGMAYIAIPK